MSKRKLAKDGHLLAGAEDEAVERRMRAGVGLTSRERCRKMRARGRITMVRGAHETTKREEVGGILREAKYSRHAAVL